ncbi:MAGUK p55 subfamily member 4 isoform B [Alligator mississippiensis]|uniref:MAGUK p55 subfamily member 4 isoform B n=1 Tax=Alligator mississippiensis TaxID=8496 RepID=A0A151N971_ALLMI|nr:MAGUK p55 subfamily member 4 isoform B [Alligator mississippiensis]
MKEKMEMPAVGSQENVLQELNLFYKRDVNGVGVLYDLLRSHWLQGLLKVYECLRYYIRKKPVPVIPQARVLSHEVGELLREAPQSTEIRELRRLLRTPHVKALLSAHDTVAQKDFEPVLPPLPDNIPENEEAMRIVCLVKNKQPLGATIKRHEITGDIMVARVISGGLADRSGLLYAGDKLVEVNGVPVEGLEPEQVIHILALSHGTIMFKLIPVSDRAVSNQTTLYVRAMADYCPLQDPTIPCADAGLPFKKGEILQIVDQNDVLWWQAKKALDLNTCAGLIPSNHLLKRKQREFWWSQPFQPYTCLRSTIPGFRKSMRLCRRKSQNVQQSCYAQCPSICYSTVAAPYEEVVRYQRHPSDRNRLIVLVGPSGVGINELRRRLIQTNPRRFQSAVPQLDWEAHSSCSCFLVWLCRSPLEKDTTRAQKSYEVNGREYHYVSKETFENLVYTHRMLEYGEYKGNLYGTSVDAVQTVLDEGKVCIVDLEPQGIQVARTHELKPYIIFIKPPSMSRMRQSRENARIITDYYVNIRFKEEDLEEMEDSAKKMEAQFGQFFDQVVMNDSLQEACVQLLSAVCHAQDEPQWVPATWICSDFQT